VTLSNDLEDLIRQNVSLGKASSGGFESCKCSDCDDYKARGGFKFEGDNIVYSCFNCGLKTGFFGGDAKMFGGKFLKLLVSFGIPEEQLKHLRAKHVITVGPKAQKTVQQVAEDIVKYAPPKSIEPPGNMHLVSEDTSPWCIVAREYLSTRALSSADYDFFISEESYHEGRLITLFWHGDRLIYWQARSMDPSIEPRYHNPYDADKDKIIFNYDELSTGPSVEPLFVVEGALDAISIGKRACAINGSTLSEWQFNELKKVARKGRKLIFIIDPDLNGYNLGIKVLKEGWHITMMPAGVGDANKARIRFGKLWLLNHITSTAVTDIAGKLLLTARCEKKKPHVNTRKTTTTN
jgi:hypothetical protein